MPEATTTIRHRRSHKASRRPRHDETRARLDRKDPDAFWCDCAGCDACLDGRHHECAERGGHPCGLITGHHTNLAERPDPNILDSQAWDDLAVLNDPYERNCLTRTLLHAL